MTQHTQGEWKIANNHELTIYAPNDTCIAVAESSNGINEAKANARLIAAAPKLLEALENTHKFMDAADISDFPDDIATKFKALLWQQEVAIASSKGA